MPFKVITTFLSIPSNLDIILDLDPKYTAILMHWLFTVGALVHLQ